MTKFKETYKLLRNEHILLFDQKFLYIYTNIMFIATKYQAPNVEPETQEDGGRMREIFVISLAHPRKREDENTG